MSERIKDGGSASDLLAKLYDAASKGFHTSGTYGPESRHLHQSKFQTIQDLLAFEDAWIKAMLSAREVQP